LPTPVFIILAGQGLEKLVRNAKKVLEMAEAAKAEEETGDKEEKSLVEESEEQGKGKGKKKASMRYDSRNIAEGEEQIPDAMQVEGAEEGRKGYVFVGDDNVDPSEYTCYD
jgi:hypothetical protein